MPIFSDFKILAARAVAGPTAKGAWIALAVTLCSTWEGMATHAYRDPVGVVTICEGTTNADRPVHMGDVVDKDTCKQWLESDLVKKYKPQVDKCIHVPMPPHRTAAMVSFTYNVGGGALCQSSVARKLNAGDVQGGCNALMLYDRAGGREIQGLKNRRTQERQWCLRND